LITIKRNIAILVFILISFQFLFINVTYAQTQYNRTYKIVGTDIYMLNVTVPETLYTYYKNLGSSSAFDKYVTPIAVKPIADSLRSLFTDDEDFINQVLKWDRQHIYEVTDIQYPIQTLAIGKGDCDVFSVLVASVLIAGGINNNDIVFVTWNVTGTTDLHMNLAINLLNPPEDYGVFGNTLYWVTTDNNNKKYYIAECTDQGKDPAQTSWLLGNRPEILSDVIEVIPIVNYKTDAPDQVESYFLNTQSTTVTVSSSVVALTYIFRLKMNGNIGANLTGESVSLYYSQNNASWRYIGEAKTIDGSYSYEWYIFDTTWSEWLLPNRCFVKAFWSGNTDYQGGTSNVTTNYVIPLWLIITIISLLSAFMIKKKRSSKQ